jgi:hypothetical protein
MSTSARPDNKAVQMMIWFVSEPIKPAKWLYLMIDLLPSSFAASRISKSSASFKPRSRRATAVTSKLSVIQVAIADYR